MYKYKSQGGHRKSRRPADFASDVEIVEADLPRSERLRPKGKNRTSFQARHEDDRRSRVGRGIPPTQAQPLPSNLRRSQTARGYSITTGKRNMRARPAAAAAAAPPSPSLNPFAPRGGSQNRQLSVFSAVSTSLSATQSGPWCDKCNRLNRQLHGYLLDILKTAEQTVDEWAYAVGASPDHMECEPAPERIIPEGYRRCSQQCQSCVARRFEGGAGVVTPPGSSGWSGGGNVTAATNGYQNQLGMVNERQMERLPYAQAGPGSAFTQATPEPNPSPPGGPAQVNHQLVAVPEGHNLLHARWAGSPVQMPLARPPPAPAQQPHPPLQRPWECSARRTIGTSHKTPAEHWEYPGAGVPMGPPGHALLPPVFEHEHSSVALPLTPPKEPSNSNNKTSPRRVTPSPVYLAARPAANGGGFQGQVAQW